MLDRLRWAEEQGATRDGDYADWMADGDVIVTLLADAVHGDIDPRSLDESAIREWQQFGRDLLRHQQANMAAVGKKLRASGLSEEDAAAALSKGLRAGMTVDEAIEAVSRGELLPGA